MELKHETTVGDMRKQAIIDTFFETLKKCRKIDPFASLEKIIEKAASTTAPRFFVSFENARRFVSMLVRKKRLPLVNKNKIEMYKELYRRYMKQCKGKVGNYTILESIIEEPAPSFYLDAGSFRGIVYRTLGERSLQIV